MRESRRDLNLSQKPLDGGRQLKLRAQYLERDVPVVLDVLGEIDRRHTAATELSNYLPAIEIGTECRYHRRKWCGLGSHINVRLMPGAPRRGTRPRPPEIV